MKTVEYIRDRIFLIYTDNIMVSLASSEPLKLQYYLEDEYRWCKLEIIKSVMGRLEETAVITSLSQLPESFHARYLYSEDTNVWFYEKVNREDVRILPGSVHDRC